MTVGEVESQLLGLRTLSLQQETVGLRLLEGQERHIVRQKMRVGLAQDVVDVQRVAPDGVLSGVGLPGRHNAVCVPGDKFALLAEDKIPIRIV